MFRSMSVLDDETDDDILRGAFRAYAAVDGRIAFAAGVDADLGVVLVPGEQIAWMGGGFDPAAQETS